MSTEASDADRENFVSKLRAGGVEVGDFLGVGTRGRIYKAAAGRVVKITQDSKEARLATWQQENRHPMLPSVFSVWWRRRESTLLFAIERQDAADLEIAKSQQHYIDLCLLGRLDLERYLTHESLELLRDLQTLQTALKAFLSIADCCVANIGNTLNGRVLRDMGSCSFLDPETKVPKFDRVIASEADGEGSV